MPWCPKCKVEYRDEFKICSDCGMELVKELAEEPEADEKHTDEYDVEAFLVSVVDSFEASIIEANLKQYGIPVLEKHKDTGGYLSVYMGATPFGIDLYVPSKLLEKAKEITAVTPDTSENVEQDALTYSQEINLQSLSENIQKRRRTFVILIFVVPFLIWLILSFLKKLAS